MCILFLGLAQFCSRSLQRGILIANEWECCVQFFFITDTGHYNIRTCQPTEIRNRNKTNHKKTNAFTHNAAHQSTTKLWFSFSHTRTYTEGNLLNPKTWFLHRSFVCMCSMCFKNKLCGNAFGCAPCPNNIAHSLSHTHLQTVCVLVNRYRSIYYLQNNIGLVSKWWYYHFGHVYVSLHFRTFFVSFCCCLYCCAASLLHLCHVHLHIWTIQFRSIPLIV